MAYFPFSALTYTFLPYAASCLVLYYGGKLIHHGALHSGELVSFVFYMQVGARDGKQTKSKNKNKG